MPPKIIFVTAIGTGVGKTVVTGLLARYLAGLGRATWTTIRIATLGSLLGALLGPPLAILTDLPCME